MDTSQQEPFPFEELSIEIQDYILDLAPQTILSLMQTSHGMRELNRKRFLQIICQRKISKNEFIRYLNEEPQMFELF